MVERETVAWPLAFTGKQKVISSEHNVRLMLFLRTFLYNFTFTHLNEFTCN